MAYYSLVSYKLSDPVLTKTSQLNKTFTSEAIVSKTENNSYNCKLHLQKFIKLTPDHPQ